MKKTLATIFFLILILFTLVSCNASKEDDSTIRTTITADEWNKHVQMDNYSGTLVLPDYKIHSKISKNAVQENYQRDNDNQLTYYEKESGIFYEISNYNGAWYKYEENFIGGPFVASHVDFRFSNFNFEDLIYDEDNKTYIVHFENHGEEISTTYKFENGVIVSIKESSPNWDYEAVYYITDIGTTEVDLPKYIETSTHYGFEVMPNASSFKRVDITSYSLSSSIKEAHMATNGGYVFKVEFDGYFTGNVAMIGVDDNGVIVGTKFIQGHDQKELFNNGYYNGVDLGSIDNVDIVSGCTISSKAYRAIIKDVLEAAKVLG